MATSSPIPGELACLKHHKNHTIWSLDGIYSASVPAGLTKSTTRSPTDEGIFEKGLRKHPKSNNTGTSSLGQAVKPPTFCKRQKGIAQGKEPSHHAPFYKIMTQEIWAIQGDRSSKPYDISIKLT